MSSVDPPNLPPPVPPPPPPAPHPVPLTVQGAHHFLRFLWTSNPFYVISAALFLFGLRLSFSAQGRETDSWMLMGGLAGYTLLLASAALVLVRFARVWNDVRTVLLLVVLMFLATSVTFDELLVVEANRGRWFFIGGLVFSIAMSEGLLRGIRLRLPILFRLPYHLTLALFFLYPLALVPVLGNPHDETLMWRLWGFAPAVGLAFLTLIPAIRRGREYTRDNGSPWPWPFYPYSVFVFLAFAVCGRAFLLCWSFHLLPDFTDHRIFGPYFLIPFGLAVAVLLLEIALVDGNRWARWIALVVPLALVPVAGIGHRPEAIYAEFLRHFHAEFGGMPLFAAFVAAGAFYVYAAIRGVPVATEGLSLVVAALAFVGPDTLTFEELRAPKPSLLAAAVGLQVVIGLLRRDVWRLVLGVAMATGWGGTLLWRGYRSLREDVVGLDYIAAGLVLLPIAVLISLGKGGALARPTMETRNEPVRE
jgi:hypothetical protein